MSLYQNLKFYTICRHRLKINNAEIYNEIKSLFGDYVTRSQKESVDKWVNEYIRTDVSQRDNLFNYSRRIKYAYDCLEFDLTSTNESNSIQRKRFYALCRYKFETDLNKISNEVNQLFYKDAITTLNGWIVEGYKLTTSPDYKPLKLVEEKKLNENELQTKCIQLINSELNLKRELERVNREFVLNQNQKENLEKLNKKYENDIALAKSYWEQIIHKLNMDIDELKKENSKQECELYKLKLELKETKSNESLFEEFLNRIQTLQIKLDESELKCSKLKEENKSIKMNTFKRVKRTSNLIFWNRKNVRETYNFKYKFLMQQFDKQTIRNEAILDQIRCEYNDKMFKLKEQLSSQRLLFTDGSSSHSPLNLKHENVEIKLEKYDPTIHF